MLNPRDAQGLAGEEFDLVVVGGGVYGIMVALEAARRALRPLLLERGDFGAATSHNSLRIVHGGLRYLQTLDLPRFRESVVERRWFLRHFPDLVEPLPCLMPLYGDGLRRPWPMRAALALNDTLSPRRNAGVRTDRRLAASRVLGVRATRELYLDIDPSGLKGAALWHDAFIPNVPRLLIEALNWACAHGARALNYVEARALVLKQDRIAGLRARDLVSGAELEVRAGVVLNAAGPWAPEFATACDADARGLFQPSLAWNVVFERPAPVPHGLAVQARRPGARTYFLVPWKGVLLAGTGHAPWNAGPDDPRLLGDLLEAFVTDLNEAVPGLDLGRGEVARVFAGLLPARRPGSAELTARPVTLDHKARGGPSGLFSLSGIKLTTSRRVADKVLARAFPSARPVPYPDFPRPEARDGVPDYPFSWLPEAGGDAWQAPLRRALAEEAVEHLDDLLLRRSSLGDNPARAALLAPAACEVFGWDAARAEREVEALRRRLARPDIDAERLVASPPAGGGR